MQSHYLTYKNSTIHYRQFGKGDKLLFCFHGYGRESYTFSILERSLGHRFTIIAIDIPFHGLTQWKDELIFQPKYLMQFVQQIAGSVTQANDKFTLLGFSMGGRIALYLTQLMPEKIERLILLAPDGLSFNFWRWFGSETWIGNKLLNHTIHNPAWINWVVKKAEKWHVIHSSLADFISYYIHDEEHRIILYRRWISMRKFSPSQKKLKKLIREYKIPVRMMFGSFDSVIPYQGGEKFRKGIENFATVKVVESGHHLLSEAHVSKIVQLVND
ncbi:MAG TPA: alpha/beta hydrolase [Segetibacter sp.]|jgi:pimeloyl-ACP methyl ester carboxylesterase